MLLRLITPFHSISLLGHMLVIMSDSILNDSVL